MLTEKNVSNVLSVYFLMIDFHETIFDQTDIISDCIVQLNPHLYVM